ncbi:MAG: sigma-54 dependent transcriptional regulator [Pseudomonadota bacterium]
MAQPTLHLIESLPSLADVYRSILADAGQRVVVSHTTDDALSTCKQEMPAVAVLDLRQPVIGGLRLMTSCLDLSPNTKFVLIAANGSIGRVVEAMRAGAHDYLVTPLDETRLVQAVESAMGRTPPKTPKPGSKANGVDGANRPTSEFIGSSPAMQRVYEQIGAVSGSKATVFITGASGTGKELCAKEIHARSNRSTGPFIALNCGGIPGELLESEVFGHVRGAFTGAVADRPGAAVLADGGTLFLDEICEMDLALQTKLLRFLETGTVTPVGASKPRSVDVRIICATNRLPMAEVEAGRFREDLYYRLHVLPIAMPPLRDRGEDVQILTQKLLEKISAEEEKGFTGMDASAAHAFSSYAWPGNVRELINVLRRIVVMNTGPQVTTEMLPNEMLTAFSTTHAMLRDALACPPSTPCAHQDDLVGRSMLEIEQVVIEATIAREQGSVPKAAEILGIAPSTIYRKREGWRSH